MSQPRLRSRLLHGSAITETDLRSAWRLRLEFVSLRRTEIQDWDLFSKAIRGPDRCLFAFDDESGVLQGFFTLAFLSLDIQGRRALLMYSKFFYIRPAFRGHYATQTAPWKLLPLALRRYGLRSLHFVTTAFPQSFVSLSRTAGRVYSLRDSSIPSWEQAALLSFARTLCAENFVESEGLVGGSNVADSIPPRPSAEAERLFAHYETLNPRWRDGYSLPILFHDDGGLVRHNMRRTARRLFRRR